MNPGGTLLDTERQDAMIDKDEYIKSLEISVQLLQREIESLRSRLIDSHPTSEKNKESKDINYLHGFMDVDNREDLLKKLNSAFSSINGILEAELFHYDTDGMITPYVEEIEITKMYSEIKEMEESGVLDWVIKQDELKIIPSLYDTSDTTKLNFILYPINPKSAHSNLFAAKTSLDSDQIDDNLREKIILIAESAAISIDNIISDEEIRKINKKLTNYSKRNSFNSINEIIATLAYEVGEPIQIIKANLDFIKTGIGDTKRRVEIVDKEVNKLQSISDKIQSIVSDKNLKKEFNLKELISDIKFITKSQLRRDGIKISVNDDKSDLHLNLKKNDLEQIILNLILSCRDQMPDGGVISISFQDIEDFISITLKHDGIGFSNEEIHEILNASDPKLISDKTFINHQFSKDLAENIGIKFEIVSDVNTGTSYKLLIKKD